MAPETVNLEKIARLELENKRLRSAVEELSILNEIATTISSARSLDDIVSLIIKKCVKHLNVEQGAVLLLNKEEGGNPFRTMVRKADTSSETLPYRLNTQLTGWMLKHQQPLLINNIKEDPRFQDMEFDNLAVKSLVGVPLLLKGRIIGVITVFNKKHGQNFSETDQRLLSIIAAQSAQVIENARLYEEEQAYFRMQEEMRLAREIQQKLLPASAPEIEGYDLAGITIPAKEVAGDYYDFIPLNSHRLAFCLGDVSGKGMPAALLMSNLQASIRSQELENTPARACVRRSNILICKNTPPEKFATFFYGHLDTSSHQLTYCNAGHDSPFLFSGNDEPQRLAATGIVLGFSAPWDYEDATCEIKPGDVLLIYSDGITEAFNKDEEEFGEDRLAKVVNSHLEESAQEIAHKIIEAVKQHTRGVPQMDDITLVIVKRLK